MEKKWKVIRNEDNEIVKYSLTENIYIERDYSKDFKSNRYYNHLMIDNKLIAMMGPGTGFTIKSLKELGEKYLKERDIPKTRSEIEYIIKDKLEFFGNDRSYLNKYFCQVFNSLGEMIGYILENEFDEILNKWNKREFIKCN